MASNFTSATLSRNTGTCPHGMPLGACPICNGMSGGGGGKKADFSAKSGEMSWNECYAIGQLMKAAQQNQNLDKQTDQQVLMQNAFMVKFAGIMAAKFANIAGFISQVFVKPANILNNAVQNISNNLIKPIIQTINQLTGNLANNLNNIKEAVANISDKIAAVLGEQLNALEKIVAENFEKAKKKILGLLGLVTVEENTNEESNAEEIENEEKKTSRVKKFYDRIFSVFQDKDKS